MERSFHFEINPNLPKSRETGLIGIWPTTGNQGVGRRRHILLE